MPRFRARLLFVVLVLLGSSLGSLARARSCAGVSFPEKLLVSGVELLLNGVGLREATVFDVDVFVAALYVEKRSRDPHVLLTREEHARVVLHFVRDVSAEDIIDEMDAGYRANAPKVSAADKQKLFGWLTAMKVGDAITFTYEPGKGLEVQVAGKLKGTIPGTPFASATLSVLIGPRAIDEDLRAGLLGGPCE